MSGILFLPALAMAGFGAFLIFDFLLWQFTGEITRGTIEGFEPKKKGPGSLPVFSFQKPDGTKIRVKAEKIAQLMYLLGRPEAGTDFTIIYRRGDPPPLRVHGYLYLILGGMLFVPLLAWIAIVHGGSLMAGRLAFLVVFTILMLGGWVMLKLIQRDY